MPVAFTRRQIVPRSSSVPGAGAGGAQSATTPARTMATWPKPLSPRPACQVGNDKQRDRRRDVREQYGSAQADSATECGSREADRDQLVVGLVLL